MGEIVEGFEDGYIQYVMRKYTSMELALIMTYKPECACAFERNMNGRCFEIILECQKPACCLYKSVGEELYKNFVRDLLYAKEMNYCIN